MPLQKLEFRPGLNREGTDYANEGGWYDGDKIRFRSGFPEKIGGWSQLSNKQYLGTARNLWNWQALNGSNYLGVGTNIKYYIEAGGSYNDITPFVDINALTNPTSTITATTGSSTLTIVDGSYILSPSVGDYINITGATGLGPNITAAVLNQEYVIASVISSTSYTINAYSSIVTAGSFVIGTSYVIQYIGTTDFRLIGAASNTIGLIFTATGVGTGSGLAGLPVLATAGDSGNGVAYTISYQVPIGLNTYTTGTGWGAGPWSRGTWGSAFTGTGVGQQLRLWTSDNFGQDLVLAPRGGNIFYWQAVNGVSTRAVLLSTLAGSAYVPTQTNQVLASAIQKFVIAMGANPYFPGDPATTFNPMLVRWSDQLNQNQWIPDVTNQAGEFALTNGSFIMCARSTRQEILIWTDSALYSMQYLGAPYVWGFNVLMDNISIISPNAAITVNNVTYWMGTDKFYMYSGRVETLPCALRQYIFNDINKDQGFQVFSGSNEGYNEVWWFYVSNSSDGTTIDKYVIYNYVDRVWYYGNMSRSAWLDSGIRQYPMAADYNSRILYHESSVDDNATSTTLPITAYIQSSDFDIGDGHNFGFVWRILPDINFNGSTVNNATVTMTIKPRVNSGSPYGASNSPSVVSADNYGTSQVYNIQQFTGQVYTRLRGRQLAFRIESTGEGVAWQLGMPRIDIRPDGRR
jgi:hypothetical protein